MKVLVLGATGGTGREIVRQADATGHKVTALVRRREEGERALPGTRLAVGDARDEGALRQALDGQEAVASALGSSVSGPFKRVTLFSDATRALLAGMDGIGDVRLNPAMRPSR